MRYALLFLLLGLVSPAPGLVRMIAVVDRLAEGVGKGCDSSFFAFRDRLKEIEANHPGFIVIEEWPNGMIPTAADIVDYYNRTTFGAEDILWFYYCGHGATDKVQGHFFDTTQGKILRSDIRRALEAKRTKGVLITSDSCSSPGTFERVGPVGSGAPPLKFDPWPTVSSLFANTKGTVDITAASGTQKAYLDPEGGANFTMALMRSLTTEMKYADLNADGGVNWSEMFVLIREGTQANFSVMVNAISQMRGISKLTPDDKDQIPYAFSLGTPTPLDPGTSVKVFYFLQAPFSEMDRERGTKFTFKTQFHPSYEGRAVQFELLFFNAAGQRLETIPGSRFNQYAKVTLAKHQVIENDNSPWVFFLADTTLPPIVDNFRREQPIWIKFRIFDMAEQPRLIYDQWHLMASRQLPEGIGPRE